MSAIWIGLLFQALSFLIQWLMNKKQSGVALSEREKHNLEACLHRMGQFKLAATEAGCAPDGVEGELEGIV